METSKELQDYGTVTKNDIDNLKIMIDSIVALTHSEDRRTARRYQEEINEFLDYLFPRSNK